jgi:hypothetical protein
MAFANGVVSLHSLSFECFRNAPPNGRSDLEHLVRAILAFMPTSYASSSTLHLRLSLRIFNLLYVFRCLTTLRASLRHCRRFISLYTCQVQALVVFPLRSIDVRVQWRSRDTCNAYAACVALCCQMQVLHRYLRALKPTLPDQIKTISRRFVSQLPTQPHFFTHQPQLYTSIQHRGSREHEVTSNQMCALIRQSALRSAAKKKRRVSSHRPSTEACNGILSARLPRPILRRHVSTSPRDRSTPFVHSRPNAWKIIYL